MQHGVEVDVHQVEQILLVSARDRIHRLVGEGERVQKRLHRAFEEVDERLLHRELARAVENRMLQDVEDAGVVFGRRLERDRERLVGIVVFEVQQARAAFLMLQDESFAVDLGKRLALLNDEAVRRRAGCEFFHANCLSGWSRLERLEV